MNEIVTWILAILIGIVGGGASLFLFVSYSHNFAFLVGIVLDLIQISVGDSSAHTVCEIAVLSLLDGYLSESVPSAEILIVYGFDNIIIIHRIHLLADFHAILRAKSCIFNEYINQMLWF